MELNPEQLRWRCPPLRITGGKDTDITLKSQVRASRAIEFGLSMDSSGFNIFVVGTDGVGKKWLTFQMVKEKASKMPVPNDWCYVFNFDDPKSPKALSLPPGRGRAFQEDMKGFIQHLKEELPKAFESKEYENKSKEITEKYNSQKEQLFKQLARMAEIAGFSVKFTPTGIALVPLMGGQLVPEEKLLSDPRLREFVDTKRREIDPLVADYLKKIREIDKRMNRELRRLREETALFVINTFIEDLLEKYQDLPQVKEHIDKVKRDILKNIELFLQLPSAHENPFVSMYVEKNLAKYEVNVIVDNSQLQHAPVVFEKNPTYTNLFGKIGARAEFGLYVTDFTQIVPGSIHRANGGFLILRVKDVLINPGVWHTLKKVLAHGEITVQPLMEELGLSPPVSSLFRPEPIPLNVKVILMGDPLTFHLLSSLDPEFSKLFKVKAEFCPTVDNNPENRRLMASTLLKLAQSHGLTPPSPSALSAITEYSVRLSSSNRKLSLQIEKLLDVLKEASLIAQRSKRGKVSRREVEQALHNRRFRSNLVEELIDELIEKGTIILEPKGKRVAQTYGLALTEIEDYTFARPVRITATAHCGNKGIVSIERESKLAGKIFEKAILTLSGYLGGRYGKEHPLALSASISFEQSYTTVEGDSASLAELLCLLSAISQMPLRQDVAVTGSVDQLGNVQPVGGINEKVEGFFRVCERLKVKGSVVIPKRNLHNLQLDKRVVDGVKSGRFRVFAVDTVDEAIGIVFDTEPEKVHQAVQRSLREFYRRSAEEKR